MTTEELINAWVTMKVNDGMLDFFTAGTGSHAITVVGWTLVEGSTFMGPVVASNDGDRVEVDSRSPHAESIIAAATFAGLDVVTTGGEE